MERNMEKVVSKTRIPSLRYERKFVYPNYDPEDLIALEVVSNPFCFREIFNRRTVNNCYFDDSSMSFYRQNVAGDDKRDKYRLRWYGDDFNQIQKPVLEIKKKHGAVGDKISFPLKGLAIDLSKLDSSTLLQTITQAAIAHDYQELASSLRLLKPSLYNSYERRYFLSHCDRFRITIDYNMNFYDVQSPHLMSSQATLPEVVLELKYDPAVDPDSRTLTQKLSARLSKHSKYVRGVDLMYHQPQM